MYYRDHAPPHFHAEYGDYEITLQIESGIVEGRFPKRALRAVIEWHEKHQEELLENWELAKEQEPLKRISPLE